LSKIKVDPEKLLVLIPHCLQFHGCPFKVTRDIRNCKQCGHCQIQDFLRLREALKVKVTVVTGGTLARKYTQEFHPSVVVAVACERDLTSGILDSYPLPVYGIVNERPHGPCQDTRVPVELVYYNINKFIERR